MNKSFVEIIKDARKQAWKARLADKVSHLELIPAKVAGWNNKLIFYDEYFATKPEKGFGKVNISTESANIKKVNLELFNPSDKFYYIATANSPVTVEAYLKTPGLSYFIEKLPGCN